MSLGLRQLSEQQRQAIIEELWQSQAGRCYITGKAIDLVLHRPELDIDHIVPTRDGGKDDVSNWALTFAHANRSKQASDLRVARILANLESLRAGVVDPRGLNLGHILEKMGGARFPLPLEDDTTVGQLRYSLAALGDADAVTAPVWTDPLSGLRYCFVFLPKDFLHHDDRLNPRGIGTNIRGLIEEFFKGYPQLHVPLAWVDTKEAGGAKVRIFDGQHKAAAQLLLGVDRLAVRVFLDPDPDLLLTANTHAGTTLRQVAFDKATQRHLGASIYRDRVEKFRADKGHYADYGSYTEQQLVDHFKGEQAQMRRYIIDAQRNAILYDPENRLRDYIEMGGKGTDRPISYSAIEKAVYSQIISGLMLDTPDDYLFDAGENPRHLERVQAVRLLNILADRLYIGHYDFDLGSGKLESKVQKGETIAPNHLRAHRIGREEVLYAMFDLALTVCQTAVVAAGGFWDRDRPFHKPLPENIWSTLDNFFVNFGAVPIWTNPDLSLTLFGGKQNFQFWKEVFKTGSANGTVVIAGGGLTPLSLMQPPAAARD